MSDCVDADGVSSNPRERPPVDVKIRIVPMAIDDDLVASVSGQEFGVAPHKRFRRLFCYVGDARIQSRVRVDAVVIREKQRQMPEECAMRGGYSRKKHLVGKPAAVEINARACFT